jgi:hypothetical protein
MKHLVLHPAPPYVPPVLEDDVEAPTPPTQAELNVERAKEISAAIWDTMRPVKNPGDVTKYYCGWHQHADGRVALAIEGEETVEEVDGETVVSYSDNRPVHANANAKGLRNTIEPSVTTPEADAIEAMIEAHKGGSLSLLQVIKGSPSLAPNLKEKADMDSDGWFPDPQI